MMNYLFHADWESNLTSYSRLMGTLSDILRIDEIVVRGSEAVSKAC